MRPLLEQMIREALGLDYAKNVPTSVVTNAPKLAHALTDFIDYQIKLAEERATIYHTVGSLLSTPEFKGNKSKLALTLNINRGTLRKYEFDISAHRIFKEEGKYVFLSTTKQEPK